MQITNIYRKYKAKIIKYRYWIVTIGFVALTFTNADSNLYKRYQYDEKIRELEKDIAILNEEIKINREKLYNLYNDKEGLERFAREEYFMKRSNEDIFIIK